MFRITNINQFTGDVEVNDLWNFPDSKELLMHRIHAYPAKFPAFLTPKIVNHLREQQIVINSIGDIFCGCGTSALESKLMGIDYLGYDINPVATLIAKVKSNIYSQEKLQFLYTEISAKSVGSKIKTPNKILLNERIRYWFDDVNIEKLYRILKSINNTCPEGKYKIFFLTAFSNILKASSRWLTKSIKPQIDPNKVPANPFTVFEKQVKYMIAANDELRKISSFGGKVKIRTKNILKLKPKIPRVDLIITSPPYVTSYEYADLHQLSTLWLGYVKDYKELRKGTIGSEYSNNENKNNSLINQTGKAIIESLIRVDKSRSKAVIKYFYDLDKTVNKVYALLNDNGHAAFVIGNTSYKGIYIDNAKFLIESFFTKGFSEIQVTKRKISSKILTPYRDQKGKFSNNEKGQKVYSHEFVIIAKK